MEHRRQHGRHRQHGVTLVELMIAVAIVGILAAVAYPSYRNQVMRSTRTEARVALEQRALQLEKCFTRFMSYNNAQCPAAQAGADGMTGAAHYQISRPTMEATRFVLLATAQGAQAADTACREMRIDDRGRRTPDACW